MPKYICVSAEWVLAGFCCVCLCLVINSVDLQLNFQGALESICNLLSEMDVIWFSVGFSVAWQTIFSYLDYNMGFIEQVCITFSSSVPILCLQKGYLGSFECSDFFVSGFLCFYEIRQKN